LNKGRGGFAVGYSAAAKRSLQFLGLVINGQHPAESPHTLPYLGIRSYCQQLISAGNYQHAAIVQRYIDKRDHARHQRRQRSTV
jgi:hypothetical protein